MQYFTVINGLTILVKLEGHIMTKLFQDPYDPDKYIFTDNNIIHAVGGDGTLLRAISMYRDRNQPFFGIAAGTANFLMNEHKALLPSATTKSLDLLRVEIFQSYPKAPGIFTIPLPTTIEAFNDIILGAFNGWVHFDCEHYSDILGKFSGSALIIATPQGSTGANKNNGGVVLPLASHNWAVSGVTCNKRINYVVERERITIKPTSRGTISLNADGTTHTFDHVSSIVVTTGSSVNVIFNDYVNFTKKRRQ